MSDRQLIADRHGVITIPELLSLIQGYERHLEDLPRIYPATEPERLEAARLILEGKAVALVWPT